MAMSEMLHSSVPSIPGGPNRDYICQRAQCLCSYADRYFFANRHITEPGIALGEAEVSTLTPPRENWQARNLPVTIPGVNKVEKMVVLAQAAWAARTVKLAPEPPGDRVGLAEGGNGSSDSGPLDLVAVGDSLVAGSGVTAQSEALTPLIAEGIAAREDTPVHWRTYAKLGATMRRVRYKYLPQIETRPDILFVCAGSNDVMARRGVNEWRDDLQGTLDEAQELSDRVWLCSSGQPHNSPVLPKTLRRAIEHQIDAQTAVSREICAERGIPFADVTHIDLPDGFWASDGFHPSRIGYETAAWHILRAEYGEQD